MDNPLELLFFSFVLVFGSIIAMFVPGMIENLFLLYEAAPVLTGPILLGGILLAVFAAFDYLLSWAEKIDDSERQ